MQRGVRVNATNMGDDIPLHLAAAHGHAEIVQIVNDLKYLLYYLFLIYKLYSFCANDPMLMRSTSMATHLCITPASGDIRQLPKSSFRVAPKCR